MSGITSLSRSSGPRVAPYHTVGDMYYTDAGVGKSMIRAEVNRVLNSLEAAVLAADEIIPHLPPFFVGESAEIRLLNNIYYFLLSLSFISAGQLKLEKWNMNHF